MRHLQRSHLISVAWLHEVHKLEEVSVEYELSCRMAADIYTQAFTDPLKWKHACWLIGVIDPDGLLELLQSGGIPPEAVNGKSSKEPTDERNPDGSGIWIRRDYGAKRFRMPTIDGPKHIFITRRVTTDVDTGEIIEDKKNVATEKNKWNLYLVMEGGPKNISTAFHYSEYGREQSK